MADTDKLVKVGQLDTIVDEIVDKFGETNERLGVIKKDLFEIRTPGPNTVYVTEFANYKYASGVYCSYVDPTTIKLWGTARSWVRFNLLNGNSQVIAGTPTFTNDIAPGTYTLKANDTLYVYYGVDWASRQRWVNGASVTFDNPTTIFFAVSSSSQNFGTELEPTYFSVEIYSGAVSIEPSAVDNVSRTAIGKTNCDNILVHGDFDYDKPYNIFNGSTFTENSKINYYDGTIEADSEGRLATDYIEIDPSKEYLCVDIYVVLNGEGGTLVSGGNRVWIKNNCAFYDANKTYISYISDANAASKAIPSTAKYVRLTINKAEVIPFAILFYGEYTTQQWVRYTAYRKDVKEASVYASTGMESLKMVMFGDSITHGLVSGSDNISYVDYANDMLRSNIINCGLGGSRMSQGQPDTIGLGSFASLCENITSTESTAWDALDTYASSSHTDWAGHVNALKTVDWSTVNAVGILYGANDWHNNVPVGTEYNENPLNYDGACAYGLKLLLTKYPHLQVIIFTPFFRVIDENTNSDANNSAGLNMDAYGESLKNILPVLHCPIVDSGNELGINRYTIYSYAPVFDGTHPRKVLGQRRIGKFVAEAVKRFIAPY